LAPCAFQVYLSEGKAHGANPQNVIGYFMKYIFILIISIIFFTGCENSVNNNLDNTSSKKSAPDSIKANNSTASTMAYIRKYAIWGFEYDSIKGDDKPTKLRPFKLDTLTANKIEDIVNFTWPKVQVKILRSSKDTIYISIPNSEELTQQMGTTGAEEFMVSTTFSFTEIKGVNYVTYDFIEGDHATPGTYSRKSWDYQNK
jgi:hypothetical protein